MGHTTAAVHAADCTHLTGDDWTVWPTVLAVNMQRYEAGRRDMLWGVTFRSKPTRSLLLAAAEPRLRVCAVPGADLQWPRKHSLGTLVRSEQHAGIEVFSRAPRPTANPTPLGRTERAGDDSGIFSILGEFCRSGRRTAGGSCTRARPTPGEPSNASR